LCHLAAEADERYLQSVLREGGTDAGLLHRLLDSGGFCKEHVWALVRLEQRDEHDGLTTASLIRPFLENARDDLAALPSARERREHHKRGPVATCPACSARAQMARIHAHELGAVLARPDVAEKLSSRAQGLCLPHFRAVWDTLTAPATRELLRTVQLRQLKQATHTVDEYMRKHNHIFRDEPRAAEWREWAQAVGLLYGAEDRLLGACETEAAPCGPAGDE
jgi:hypothetical protein